ncbi:DNA-binding transcriptional regulator, PadR family [Paenibacillus catalpae]|uniref:DNA-binding transcriptional regulator, PadR family n=1 Tax=Paenibacillus catalpae TaxID=1045775 RepID=A0A1I2DKK0_9BACL|nr:PadR family transcriptional regulator [Paenibacillus catalpae]SFE80803.1 DNA-binding transcriptional regulator, PadR family [Paenibacillus catalpae]
MAPYDELLAALEVELKRGTLTLAVLSQLQTPKYGYSLLQDLVDKHVDIEAGTLYPLLRRLEKQGILTSDWDTAESRPRKYYTLSATGNEIFKKLSDNWRSMTRQIEQLLGGEDNGDH